MEESLCMQSTLYYSLAAARKRAWDEGMQDARGTRIHIPEEGCVVSPDVEILRGGTSCGYRHLEEVSCLAAVFSVAMPNKNAQVVDTPVYNRGEAAYRTLLYRTSEVLMLAAMEHHIDVLIMPDIGCGVFHNDPKSVGCILGNVIGNSNGYLKTLILTGERSFAESVMQAAKPSSPSALPGPAGVSTEDEVRSHPERRTVCTNLHCPQQPQAAMLHAKEWVPTLDFFWP